MNRGLHALVVAQFLSAFSDNAILFVVVAIVLKSGAAGGWYIPALQSVFLVAFVACAPWVGPAADQFSKPRVLIAANLLKAAGTLLILAGLEPLLAYAVVGAGAALYSPAKYGILPELVPREHLVRANSLVEGSTIAAILVGTLVGAKLADHSVPLALSLTAALYGLSAMAGSALPPLAPRGARLDLALGQLAERIRTLFASPRARLVVLSLSLFWASAATLRIVLVAWAPLVLGTKSAGDIAELTLFLAIGIIIGSLAAPRLITLERIRQARLPAYGLAMSFLLLAEVDGVWAARTVLLAIGTAGGLFVVPLNAAMQHIGHQTIGSGGAVALQNLFQNLTMLVAVSGYTLAAALGAGPVSAIFALGALMLAATLAVSRRLPPA
ncbi:MAG: lysophospholipid transporter LplT [Gammaproteobacteria bacterium]|nr:lysophospholipid transporter LplT [Gammaproteobacteria bacterium]